MLEQIGQEPAAADNYDFASGGDIDQFIRQMRAPKQDMHIDPADGLDRLEEADAEAEEPDGPVDVQMKQGAARAAGRLVAAVIDNTLPGAMAWIGKDDDPTPYKADPESRADLEEALTEYMRLKGGDIPPGMMVLILVLTIYGSKMPMVFQHRKLNTEREQLERSRQQLEERARKLDLREMELNRKAYESRTGSQDDHTAGD